MPTTFIVLTHARSGSNLLVYALQRHPELFVANELFNESRRYRELEAKTVDGRIYQPGEDATAFLRSSFIDAEYPAGIRAAGFKIFYSQARESPAVRSAWDLLQQRQDLRIIHLLRDNLFASLVSYQVAWRTGDWAVFAEEGRETTRPPAFAIDPRQCEQFFAQTLDDIANTRAVFARHERLEVSYERDLRPAFAATLASIHRFLGVVPQEVIRPPLLKQGQGRWCEQVTNYPELREHFKGTRFAPFFAEEGRA